MRYFQQFPKISYTQREFSKTTGLQAITRSVPNMTVKLEMELLNQTKLPFQTYIIQDKDRPDTIAAQMYGSTQYAWIVLLVNKMRDWYDWPLGETEFYDYINRKYESVAGVRDGVARSAEQVVAYRWNFSTGDTIIPIILDTSMGGIDLPAKGTISVVDGSTTVSGAHTEFSTIVPMTPDPGSFVIVVGDTTTTVAQYRTIISVADDDSLIVDAPFDATITNASYRLLTGFPDNFTLSAVETITAYEQEVLENDTKRRILLPDRESLSYIIEQFTQAVKQ